MTTITTCLDATMVAANVSPQSLLLLLDDPWNPTGQLNTILRDHLIARVNGDFLSKFRLRHKLPLEVNDDDAANVLATITGHAMARFLYYAAQAQLRPDSPRDQKAAYKDQFDASEKFLDDVARGVATLGAAQEPPRSDRGDVLSNAEERVFNRDTMKGW